MAPIASARGRRSQRLKPTITPTATMANTNRDGLRSNAAIIQEHGVESATTAAAALLDLKPAAASASSLPPPPPPPSAYARQHAAYPNVNNMANFPPAPGANYYYNRPYPHLPPPSGYVPGIPYPPRPAGMPMPMTMMPPPATAMKLPALPPPPPPPELPAHVRQLSDSELVRLLASEFKSRGYAAAVQLTALSADREQPKSHRKKKDNGAEAAKANNESSSSHATTAPQQQQQQQQQTKLPTPSLPLPSYPFFPAPISTNATIEAAWDTMYDQLCNYLKQHDGAFPQAVMPKTPKKTTTTKETTTATTDAKVAATVAAAPPPPPPMTPNEAYAMNLRLSAGTTDKVVKRKEHDVLYTWSRRQLLFWSRMRKDNNHNLTLERISKLHALDFDKHTESVAKAPSSSEIVATLAKTTTAAKPAAIVPMVVDGPEAYAREWREKFYRLKRYSEEHGELSDIVLSGHTS